MEPIKDVSDAELSVLQVLWDRGPATIRQITDVLYPGGGDAGYATVQVLLNRLENKRHVRRDRALADPGRRPVLDRFPDPRRRSVIDGFPDPRRCAGRHWARDADRDADRAADGGRGRSDRPQPALTWPVHAGVMDAPRTGTGGPSARPVRTHHPARRARRVAGTARLTA